MKNSPARLRLDPDVEEEVRNISTETGLSQVEVIRQIVRAGANAIKENGYVLPTPLHVRVETEKESDRVRFPPHKAQHAVMNEKKDEKKK